MFRFLRRRHRRSRSKSLRQAREEYLRHRCRPGVEERHPTPEERAQADSLDGLAGRFFVELDVPGGSLWRCRCGRAWVSESILSEGRSPRLTWRPATAREERALAADSFAAPRPTRAGFGSLLPEPES